MDRRSVLLACTAKGIAGPRCGRAATHELRDTHLTDGWFLLTGRPAPGTIANPEIVSFASAAFAGRCGSPLRKGSQQGRPRAAGPCSFVLSVRPGAVQHGLGIA
jgi:hypothetical protein